MYSNADCRITDSIFIQILDVFCDEDKILIPTAFTPNNLPPNNTYRIIDTDDIITSFKLEIFNRFGQKVYASSNKFGEWDGTFKNELLAPQVFDFYIELECIGEKKLLKKEILRLLDEKSTFILLLIFAFNLQAQDIHFSQFTISKIGLNPAIVGSQQADYKTRFQKRTQWKSVANPFSTIAIGFEAKSLMKKTAAGFEFFNDKVGDAHFTTSKFNTAISRTFTLDKQQKISAGLLLGFAQRKVDFSALIFEQLEQLENPSFSFFDIGLGGITVGY